MLATQPSQNVQHSENVASNYTSVETAKTSFNQGQTCIQLPSYEHSLNTGNDLRSNNTNYRQPVVIQNMNGFPRYGRNTCFSKLFFVIFFAAYVAAVVFIIIHFVKFVKHSNNVHEDFEKRANDTFIEIKTKI